MGFRIHYDQQYMGDDPQDVDATYMEDSADATWIDFYKESEGQDTFVLRVRAVHVWRIEATDDTP